MYKEYNLSPAQIAKRINKHPRTVARLILSGALTGIRVGRSFRVSEKDLDDFLFRSLVNPSAEGQYSEQLVSEIQNLEQEQAERVCEEFGT